MYLVLVWIPSRCCNRATAGVARLQRRDGFIKIWSFLLSLSLTLRSRSRPISALILPVILDFLCVNAAETSTFRGRKAVFHLTIQKVSHRHRRWAFSASLPKWLLHTDRRSMTSGPGALDQPMADAAILRLGDATPSACLAGRSFAGDEAEISHELTRALEPFTSSLTSIVNRQADSMPIGIPSP